MLFLGAFLFKKMLPCCNGVENMVLAALNFPCFPKLQESSIDAPFGRVGGKKKCHCVNPPASQFLPSLAPLGFEP
jgi:hypothetical protein